MSCSMLKNMVSGKSTIPIYCASAGKNACMVLWNLNNRADRQYRCTVAESILHQFPNLETRNPQTNFNPCDELCLLALRRDHVLFLFGSAIGQHAASATVPFSQEAEVSRGTTTCQDCWDAPGIGLPHQPNMVSKHFFHSSSAFITWFSAGAVFAGLWRASFCVGAGDSVSVGLFSVASDDCCCPSRFLFFQFSLTAHLGHALSLTRADFLSFCSL